MLGVHDGNTIFCFIWVYEKDSNDICEHSNRSKRGDKEGSESTDIFFYSTAPVVSYDTYVHFGELTM